MSLPKLLGLLSLLFLFVPVLAAAAYSSWLFNQTSYSAQFPNAEPPCRGFDWPTVQPINYTKAPQQGVSQLVPSSQIPLLSYQKGLAVQVGGTTPVSIVAGPTGIGYGLFANNGQYYLAESNDFAQWARLSNSVVPPGYQVSPGKGLAVTREGVIMVSATRLAGHQNSTVFQASYDRGSDFQTVLNLTLRAKPESYTGINTGPGTGFWHGVQETRNGYLFAGLYNPQGLIFRSTDSGHTWQLVFNASRGSDWHNEIHDLQVNPLNDAIYATTDDESGTDFNQSLLVSLDYGNSWVTLYNAMTGGAGLPPHLTPTTIGFLNGGNSMVLGLEGWYKSGISRTMFILDSNTHGCVAARYSVSASSQTVDPFISWWMSPKNNDAMFILTHENDPAPKLGVGLFILSSSGSLDTIMSLKAPDAASWYTTSFLQVAGPSANGNLGILIESGSETYLLITKA